MAPYIPQNSHYVHVNVSEYPTEVLYKFATKKRFYKLTRQLKLKYLWFNEVNKVIEIWGPYEALRDHSPARVISDEFSEYMRTVEVQ